MESILIESDGASIPFWKRKNWTKTHGAEAMINLDIAGNYHDALIHIGINPREARELMMLKMISLEIPQEITEYVIYWLGRYDSLPRCVRLALKIFAKNKTKKVEVEI